MAFCGLLCMFIILCLFRTEYMLYRYGVAVQGQVTETYWSLGQRGGMKYHLNYSFPLPSGGRQFGTSRITRHDYQKLKPEDSIELRYVPSSPAISDYPEASHTLISMVIQIILFPIGCVMVLLAIRGKSPPTPIDTLPPKSCLGGK